MSKLLLQILCLSVLGLFIGDWLYDRNIWLGVWFTFIVVLCPWLLMLGYILMASSKVPTIEHPRKYFEGLLGLAFGDPWVCSKCQADNYPSNRECWRCHDRNPKFQGQGTS